jgi:magnesium transporter
MSEPVAENNLNDPVTQHMRVKIAPLHNHQTVGEALAALRASPPPARIVYFYVVDENGRLVGVIPSRLLLLSSPEAKIDDIMIRSVVAIPAEATVLDACEFFVFHRFLAFPVIDQERRLVGIIDVELYTDEMRDLSGGLDDDLFQLIGVHLTRAKQLNPLAMFRTRFPWLICNVLGGIAAAVISGIYENQLHENVALALFIPVVLALAESVSIQSVSLAVQLMRSKKRPTLPSILQKLHREGLVGALLGVASGAIVGSAVYWWRRDFRLAMCVLDAIAVGVTVSAVLGMVVPNLLRRFKLDPQVAAGPMVLAITDVITLLSYFTVARWLLG